jgi:thiamine pyrophosphate-dependent acetolactate synthase large subunit-like protein
MASSMGVEAERVETADELCRAFDRGLAVKGPYLVEVVV